MPESLVQLAAVDECPPPEEWPAFLRWWLVVEHVKPRFYSWVAPDETWRVLLRDSRNGIRVGATRPNPYPFSHSTPAGVIYPHALVAAQVWKDAGSPLPPTGPRRS